ncbi:MAG: dihydroorotase [Negativicutes bacterium]|nr:dihydroorotase [Negativicutes bacterium]MBP8629796.1 dihydroorotase [Negativicutes bacterium]MBP9537162.1 dihydroorotase [Negativicutes bacterium]MBP9948648.1 dihydroorotase [Negativicutes bacterium]
MKLLLKSGRVVNPATNFNDMVDILIEDEKIVKIGADLQSDDAEIFDATGLIIAPGLIDMHVHLREPGQEAKEDIGSGTRAAAAGGITTVACMPNTSPVIDNSVLVQGIAQRAQQDGVVKVKVVGALSKGQEGKELAEIGDMLEAGAVAITDDGHYVDSAKLLMNGLDYIARYDLPIISHAEDNTLTEDGVMHEGAVSAMLGMKGRPAVAEDIAVSRDILLAEYTNARIHIAHISSKGAVELVRQAKKRGVKVTAEVTPHHLTLTDEEIKNFNVAAKVCPPLRSQDHVQAMIEGLKDGTIDAIVTDHSPHAFEEKDREFKFAPNGFTGMETSLGVILTNLYHTGIMTIDEIIEKMSVAPAKILKLDAGNIEIGKIADLTVIDPEKTWKVDSNKFYSRGKFTPYDGVELKGKAVATIVNGKIVMENGIIV